MSSFSRALKSNERKMSTSRCGLNSTGYGEFIMSPLSTKKRRFAFTASWSAVSVTSFGSVVKVYCLVSQYALIVWPQGKQLGSEDHVITFRPRKLMSFDPWLVTCSLFNRKTRLNWEM